MTDFTSRRGWTSAQIAKLKRLSRMKPAKEIAEELGKSLGSTRAKAHELKISLRMPGTSRPKARRAYSRWQAAFRKGLDR